MDKVLLALLLLRIYLRCIGEKTFEQEFDYLLLHSSKSQIRGSPTQSAKQISIVPFNEHQINAIHSLSKLPTFKDCVEKLKAIPTENLTEWYQADKPELTVPVIWKSESTCKFLICKSFIKIKILAPIEKSLDAFLVISTLRPDRLLASAHLLISSAFGQEFMQQDNVINLREVIESEVCL